MTEEPEHSTSLVGIGGASNRDLRVLANLYNEPFDSESVLSVVITLTHKPDCQWNTLYSAEAWFTSMDVAIDGTIFLASMDGEVHIGVGDAWQVYKLECDEGLNAVWAVSDEEAFVVGLQGECAHYYAGRWDVAQTDVHTRLNAVHGSSRQNVVAVGDNGRICSFDGSRWVEIDSPTNINLLAVYCVSASEIVIAGARGVVLRWDGANIFQEIESPEVTVTSLAEYRGEIYGAAGQNGVFVIRNDSFESIKELTVYRLRAVGDSLFAIGNRLVAQFDGSGWWGGDLDL